MASEYWMWLATGLGYGAVNSGELLSAYPDGAKAIYDDLGSARLDEILTQKQAERLAASRPEDFALRINHILTMGVRTLGYDDAQYPGMLRSIANPPPVLFVKGDAGLLNGQLSIGLVGARRPSAYGVEVVKAVGRGIALGGAIIISGLAAGLDSEAHKAALAVNGPTIACIAFGHDKCYPASNRKLMEVIERHGAVVSEYPPGTDAEKPYFLHRNRLIAGLSHGLVVAEARRHSGTMSTVNFAIDYGRDVFAVPGSIFSELSSGTNAMIGEGAYLAGSASDVLAVYGIELEGEDPVTAATKQAVEGRPVPAEAEPAWQQSLKRYTERTSAEVPPRRDELPGQQSLGEMLRGQLGDTAGGRVSATQAVEAFRMLQKQMPAATDSELDARNAALDELVAAVTDSVQIDRKQATRAPATQGAATKQAPRPAAKAAAKGAPGVEPFPWHQVERLDKREVENLSPASEKPAKTSGGRPSLGSRLFGIGRDKQPQTPPAAPVTPMRSTAPVGRIEPIGAVEAVGPVGPVGPVAGVSPVALNPEIKPLPRPPEERDEAAAGVRAPVRREVQPQRGAAPLSGRLSTLAETDAAQAAPGQDAAKVTLSARPAERPVPGQSAPAAAKPAQPDVQAAEEAREREMTDPKELLSGTAKRALEQLGAQPVTLSDICERSGLSSAEAMAALTELELAGLSRQLPGRQFVIMM